MSVSLRVPSHIPLRVSSHVWSGIWVFALCLICAASASAQSFRFTLRAEPDVIPANGISTASIFVQVPQGGGAIQAAPMVRFATTAGTIESQAQLAGGVARVLLRSASTPGTAVVTAFIGNSREAITVEFSEDNAIAQRYLEIAAPYVAYGAQNSLITASGKTGLDFGDTHIESDVRLDVDLETERLWAQGTKGGILIRQGRGAKAKELRGDRLFYDLRRRRGVMRRAETNGTTLAARQEFVGSDFALPPDPDASNADASTSNPAAKISNGALDSPPRAASGAELGLPLSAPPAASLKLETEENRGSTFVVPNAASPTNRAGALPTAPQSVPQAAENPSPQVPDVLAPRLLDKEPRPETPPAVPDVTKPDAAPKEPAAPAETGMGQMGTGEPSTIVPGSLADTPKAPGEQESRGTALVEMPRPSGNGAEVGAPPDTPAYAPLPSDSGPAPRIVEVPPPAFNSAIGYWVASRRLRVFPRDKVQFERASIFFNGKKAFGVPLYVLPLDGSFNPSTDLLSFNSEGGLALKVPFYYQASKGGTGALYLRRDPGSGFSTQPGGLSLALDQQYWLSPRSHGSFSVDQIGHGAYNVNFQHQLQLSPDTTGSFYLNMPRHRDMFARASLAKDLHAMQLGFETFYDRPEGQQDNLRTQFFARTRPKSLGRSGWNYTVGANALAVKNYTTTVRLNTSGSGGGGVGVPGQGGGSNGPTSATRTRSLIGQTLTASLQSPLLSPWRGSGFTANLLATAFNYSDGRRGAAPGVTLGFTQKLGRADVRFDYTYDRSNIGLYSTSNSSFTNYVSGSLSAQLTSKIGVSSFLSRSLSDGSTYGSADLDYYFARKWRAGLFTDLSNFAGTDSFLNYGWSIGRTVANREVSVNYDANRGRIYFELGNARY